MIQKIRVMVVDDSAVVRGMLDRALSADAGIEVVASAGNGEIAISMLSKTPVDIIILDIEMPVMDGITALPELLKISPHTRIVMSSTLTTRNADISLKAMELGAADYIAKPSSKESGEVTEFYRQLIEKVKALVPPSRRVEVASVSSSAPKPAVAAPITFTAVAPPAHPVRQSDQPPINVKALAIASSTGGPQALITIFKEFKGVNVRKPIFITQHMPANFTAILAEHITKACDIDCHEAKDGEVVTPGKIYLAPGDFHMSLKSNNGVATIVLDQKPPENFCRPSADPMLRSLAQIYREQLLVAVLTGLGADGARGAGEAVAAGATVIAQDEATSVVYGMPKAVADAKLTSAIFPLERIAPYLIKAVAA